MGLEPTEETRYFRLSSGRIIAFLSRWWRMASSRVSCPLFANTRSLGLWLLCATSWLPHSCSYCIYPLRSSSTLLDDVLGVVSGLRQVVAFLCLWKGEDSNLRSGQNLRCTLLHLRVFPSRVPAGSPCWTFFLLVVEIRMANRHHLHRLLRCRDCLIFSLLRAR